jgi:23S rRNA pseudouridine1911/1915/1917 synthase
VGAGQEARRLDQFLATALAPERTRSQIARMIQAGLITVNGGAARTSRPIHPGDRIVIPASVTLESLYSRSPTPGHTLPFSPSVPQARLLNKDAEALPGVEVLFSDPELLAINKPAGVPVHPSPGHPDSTVVDILLVRFPDLVAMAEPDGVMRPGIVHRLDKETSGVMVVARTPFAKATLSKQFKDRTVSKAYIAIVRGIVTQNRFVVAQPLGRHPTERTRMSIHSRNSRDALTEFVVLSRLEGRTNPATLIKARPQTGRTHQIRVHLASAGYPCLGDSLYGRRSKIETDWIRGRQALHALALKVSHPRTNDRLEFIAPLPIDMSQFLATAGVDTGPSAIRRWLDMD